MTDMLTMKFQALHAEREKSWSPAALAGNVAQRAALVAGFDPDAVVKAGDRIDDATLEWADGGAIRLSDLVAEGPVALIFFRFAGCPACNIALPHYDDHLVPRLAADNIRTVAVSPHLPERGLGAIADRHGLSIPVAADRDNRLGRALRLTFEPIERPTPAPGDERWIGALTGTGTYELPQPAIVIVDRALTVLFADVSPDWLRRTEADAVQIERVAAFAG